MARTHPSVDPTSVQAGGEAAASARAWENLRGDLVRLLDQVEDRFAAAGSTETAPPPSAAKSGVGAASEAADRHSAALRSVRRAIDRFSEKQGGGDPMERRRRNLEDAIGQIRTHRARQTGALHQLDHGPAPHAEGGDASAFHRAIGAMGDRLDRLERGIRDGASIQQINDVSSQIGQLSEVVELLANAVGESGQARHLEHQIARLAETVGAGAAPDMAQVNTRLDELALTIEKLADHQIQQAGRESRTGEQMQSTYTDGMRVIEASVRQIYDRLDTLERSVAVPHADLDRIAQDLAEVTTQLQSGAGDDGKSLIARVDALHQRIATLDAPKDSGVFELKSAIDDLRDAVVSAMEPRFSALESRIAALDDKVGAGDASDPAAFKGIETQIRKLATRLDETGEQIAGLSRLYENGAGGVDVEALADRVAARTTEQLEAISAKPPGMAQADLDALETRLSNLFAQKEVQPQTLARFDDVQAGIKGLNERLVQLETAVKAQAQGVTTPARPATRSGARTDTMPVEPASETPLGAGKMRAAASRTDAGGQGQALDSSVDSRLEDLDHSFRAAPRAAADPTGLPGVERPSKPQSRFAQLDGASAQPAVSAPPAGERAAEPAAAEAADAPAVSRASFIEAARRAARQQAEAATIDEPTSLIGRAMARFHRNQTETEAVPAAAPAAEKPEPEIAADPAPEIETEDFAPEDEARPNFFIRHKRALLLATGLVMVSILTANLVMQRITQTQSEAAPAAMLETPVPAPQPEAVEPSPAPAEEAVPEDPLAPDTVIPLSSIEEPPLTLGGAAPDLVAPRPGLDNTLLSRTLLADTIETGALPVEAPMAMLEDMPPMIATPVAVAPPPESVGPEALREAAAAGDMRAQFEVGAIYTEGHAVAQDYEEAAVWYERAAAQGFAPAQYRLGNLYEGGSGVERDLQQARLWYQRAAESGNRMSMHNLASLYAGGELGQQDFEAAAHWFEQAAERGLTDSQFNLGMLHARGLGVPQSFEESYKWFSIAARAGDTDAEGAREDVARSLDSDAIQRIQSEIGDWAPAPMDMAVNFAPIGTWTADFDPGQDITNREVVTRVQALLAKLGFDVGTPDGLAGPKTAEAIRQFEAATGMSPSGKVNPRLLAVLGSQPV